MAKVATRQGNVGSILTARVMGFAATYIQPVPTGPGVLLMPQIDFLGKRYKVIRLQLSTKAMTVTKIRISLNLVVTATSLGAKKTDILCQLSEYINRQ